jgi:DNA modification methylase
LWFGEPDCYRNQEAILWSPSKAMLAESKSEDWELRSTPSGYGTRPGRIADRVRERGRVTPFNLLPISNSVSHGSAGAYGHGAGTPLALCDWFARYLVPPGGTVLDPFAGAATTGLAAIGQGKTWIGMEQDAGYVEIARARLTGDFSTLEPADSAIHEEQNRLFEP